MVLPPPCLSPLSPPSSPRLPCRACPSRSPPSPRPLPSVSRLSPCSHRPFPALTRISPFPLPSRPSLSCLSLRPLPSSLGRSVHCPTLSVDSPSLPPLSSPSPPLTGLCWCTPPSTRTGEGYRGDLWRARRPSPSPVRRPQKQSCRPAQVVGGRFGEGGACRPSRLHTLSVRKRTAPVQYARQQRVDRRRLPPPALAPCMDRRQRPPPPPSQRIKYKWAYKIQIICKRDHCATSRAPTRRHARPMTQGASHVCRGSSGAAIAASGHSADQPASAPQRGPLDRTPSQTAPVSSPPLPPSNTVTSFHPSPHFPPAPPLAAFSWRIVRECGISGGLIAPGGRRGCRRGAAKRYPWDMALVWRPWECSPALFVRAPLRGERTPHPRSKAVFFPPSEVLRRTHVTGRRVGRRGRAVDPCGSHLSSARSPTARFLVVVAHTLRLIGLALATILRVAVPAASHKVLAGLVPLQVTSLDAAATLSAAPVPPPHPWTLRDATVRDAPRLPPFQRYSSPCSPPTSSTPPQPPRPQLT